MGYSVTNVTVPESDEVATLTVVVIDPIETSFSLIVNTLDGTATGPACLIMYPYTQLHIMA